MARAEFRPHNREKPNKETIDRFLNFCEAFRGGSYSHIVSINVQEEDFDRLSVFKEIQVDGKLTRVTFISYKDTAVSRIAYALHETPKGREVTYESRVDFARRGFKHPIENLSRKQRRQLKKRIKPFEKKLGDVSQGEFSRKVEELEVLSIKYKF